MRQEPGVAANIDHASGYTLQATASPDVPSHALVAMKDYLAKATLVPNAELFATDEALLKRLKDPAWNPRASVLINKVDPGQKLPTSKIPEKEDVVRNYVPGPDKLDLETYTPTEIEIKAHSSRGDYVLINDQYDPDWQVQIDGKTVPMIRSDYIMRAVQIPPGDSTITMHYVAHYHVAGLILPAETMNNFSDGTMLAAWLIAFFGLRRKKLT
jgi:hypothetical protein